MKTIRVRWRLAILAVVVLVILSLALSAAVRYLRVDEIRLPDLRGMPYGEAAELLRSNDLEPVSYPENVSGVAVEVVTSQTPPPGSVVRKGRNVAIGVNRPPEAARAPVLQGLLLEQALNTVRAVNLRVESTSYLHSSQPAGRVIDQVPEPGEQVDAGEGLSIVVSRGPELPRVAMPDFTGVPVERAREQLAELGFRSVQAVPSGVSFDGPGLVANQEPAAGTEVRVSTPVKLGFRLSAREVVPVPGITGQSAQLAERMLRAAGLQIGHLLYVDDPAQPSGTVVSVEPETYTLRGTPVTLTLNARQGSFDELAGEDDFDSFFGDDGFGDGGFGDDGFGDEGFGDDGFGRNGFGDDTGGGPADDERQLDRAGTDEGDRVEEFDLEPSGRRVSVTFDPATLGVRSLLERDYDLRLVVQDDNGERTVIDRRVDAGEPVSAVVMIEGDALLQTYINDVFFQAWRP